MKILSAFLLTLILLLTGCGNSESKVNSESVKTSKFLKVSFSARNTVISVNQYVMITFSSNINPETVDASSVYIIDVNNHSVAASLTTSNNRVSIIPNEYFLPNEQYTIVVTTTVEDIIGRRLENVFTFPFKTSSAPDTLPPSLLSLAPADGTSADKSTYISMEFDEVIADNGAMLEVKDSIMNTIVSGTSTISNNTLRFVPDSDLVPGSIYTVTLQGTVKDVAGNAYAGVGNWDFSVNPLDDTTPPSLLSLTPADGTSAEKTTEIMMAFDETIADNGAMLEVKDSIMNTIVSGTSTISNNTLRFVPDSDLVPGSIYTVTLQGTVKDVAGNAYAGVGNWDFSIIATSDLSVLSLRHYGRFIGILFSEDLDPLTVSGNDFAINGGAITFKLFKVHEDIVILKVDSNIIGTEDITVSGTIKDIYGNSHNNGVPAIYNLGG